MTERAGDQPQSDEFCFVGSKSYVNQRLAIDSLATRLDNTLGPISALPNTVLLALVGVLALRERIFANGHQPKVQISSAKQTHDSKI